VSELINRTLDISRIEVGRFEIDRAPFDLRTLVEETAAMLRLRAAQKGLTLDVVVDPSTPRIVDGDAVALRRVLINVLGNAVKFTEQGGVTLRLMPAVSGTETAPLLFSIDDTGIGIPPQKLDLIFDSFAQADPSINRRFGGAGLGLSISRELVELMGGRIWVRSQVGHGSTFSFTVPLPAAGDARPGPARPSTPAPLVRPLRLLLVEDSPLNRLVVTAHLEKTSDMIDVAENGRAAVDAVKARRYDLVLMDVHMPEMDGYEATETIRRWEQEERRPRTPIVALTAHAMKQDVERSRLAGCDEHVTKPVRKQTLLDLLDRYRAVQAEEPL
jgi:CheY-like chemotaxis protein